MSHQSPNCKRKINKVDFEKMVIAQRLSVTEAAHIIFNLRGRLSAGVSLDFVIVSRGEFDLAPDRVFPGFQKDQKESPRLRVLSSA